METKTQTDALTVIATHLQAAAQPKKWNWKEKLGSRKFWMALVGCIAGICGMFGFADSNVAIISFAILELGSILGYCIVEGHVDAAHAKQLLTVLQQIIDMVEKRPPDPVPIEPTKVEVKEDEPVSVLDINQKE